MPFGAYAPASAVEWVAAGKDDMAGPKRTAPEVEIAQGRLSGRWKAKGTVAVFKGIPFAEPPVGDRRWKAPGPAPTWSGTRQATKHGPMAIQRAAGFEEFMGNLLNGQGWHPTRVRGLEALVKRMPTPEQSEDCLYLSVRTPSLEPSAKLPVMVWIHGGDHQDGSGSDAFYESNALASHGVVTVSINYRLGLFGYFAHPDLRAESVHGVSGNYGTLDQIAALEWVRDNIAAFGGDPDNVTIFGESAGGESVLHLMTSPLARGLFHRAIAQSPGSGGQMVPLDRPFLAHPGAEARSRAFAEAAGATGEDPVAQLRSMSADRLHEIVLADDETGDHYPTIDGHVLPESPYAAFAAGRQAPVPLVIGSNADEGTLLISMMQSPMVEYRYLPVPDDGLQPEVREALGDDIDRLIEIYPGLDRGDVGAATDFLGDRLFGAAVYHYARHHAIGGNPTHVYFFTRVPKQAGQTLGAYHAAEIPFVHGSNVPILPMSSKDKALSREIMRYWTDHARRADVNAGAPGVNHPEWPAFDPADPQWIRFDHTVTVEPVQRREQYEIFGALIDRRIADLTAD